MEVFVVTSIFVFHCYTNLVLKLILFEDHKAAVVIM